ncbi:hypothetical protein [Streptomyces sp. NPDC054797]
MNAERRIEFLTWVCEALSALPLDRMEREAGVLATEGAGVADLTSAELLSFRYGRAGPGLGSWEGPAPDRIPTEAVREVAAHSVLVLTGRRRQGCACRRRARHQEGFVRGGQPVPTWPAGGGGISTGFAVAAFCWGRNPGPVRAGGRAGV